MAYPFECNVHIRQLFKLLFGEHETKVWDDGGNLTIETPQGCVDIISAINAMYLNSKRLLTVDDLGGVGGAGREVLTEARTYYVRTDGNDANSGLANSALGAFLTIQKAIDVVCDSLDMRGHQVTIQVADGTFTGNIILRSYLGRFAPIIIGNTTTPSSCLLSTASHAVNAAHSGPWYVKGFKITTTVYGVGVVAYRGAIVYLSNIDFGVCSGQHMFASNGIIVVETNYAISGGCLHHMVSEQGGVISNGGAGRAVTITNTPNLGVFALAQTRGSILFGGNTYSGSATGTRYSAVTGSFIQAGTATPPGNVVGSVSTNGYFTA